MSGIQSVEIHFAELVVELLSKLPGKVVVAAEEQRAHKSAAGRHHAATCTVVTLSSHLPIDEGRLRHELQCPLQVGVFSLARAGGHSAQRQARSPEQQHVSRFFLLLCVLKCPGSAVFLPVASHIYFSHRATAGAAFNPCGRPDAPPPLSQVCFPLAEVGEGVISTEEEFSVCLSERSPTSVFTP